MDVTFGHDNYLGWTYLAKPTHDQVVEDFSVQCSFMASILNCSWHMKDGRLEGTKHRTQ